MEIWKMQKEAYAHAKNAGFHDLPESNSPYRAMALIASEVGELIEAYHKGIAESNHGYNALAEELADIVIRCGDLSEKLDLDLDAAVTWKIEFNKTRGHLHGDKKH